MIELIICKKRNTAGSTPSSATTIVGSSGPDFSDYMRQGAQYQSRSVLSITLWVH